ncbi:hypothetical protein PN462_16285 [Spirulina sp. CS-785/01]|uniref:DUF6825 family protein n=1 Tax=Spirulina sp. CS-785/01 TaxID=3021716 RepID=UPI00232EDAD6|nr:hypothetical protein [Spirulina sp. CS-785/01]MDB9314672.1 hypothetical protein [Spirulina sp. CS-785/01]
MSNPVTRAFFIGRAFAQVLNEKVEDTLTNTLSDLGKFDAEQRENFRQFTEEVISRAEREMGQPSGMSVPDNSPNGSQPADLQETIDNMRAEIAQLRSALASHRQSSSS